MTSNSFCGEEARILFHERVGQYFVMDDADGATTSTCAICGVVQENMVLKKGEPRCAPQAVVTAKRAQKDAGATCLNQPGSFVLITPSKTLIVSKIQPTRPLPATIEHRGPQAGIIAASLREFIRRPAELPYLIVRLDKKAAVPWALGRSEHSIVISGGEEPITVMRSSILDILDCIQTLGDERHFLEAIQIRKQMADGKLNSERYEKFCAKHPAITPAFLRRLPSDSQSEAAKLARLILKKD